MSQATLKFSDDGKKLSFEVTKPPQLTHRLPSSQDEPLTTPLAVKPREYRIEDFTLIKQIGSGRFGKVFLAEEQRSGVRVAIKSVEKTFLEKYDFFCQMKKELEIQYRLSAHPNIARILAYFYDNEQVYIVLEFAEGGNLYQKMKRDSFQCLEFKAREQIVRKIIQQMISALWYLQQRNVMHRDIKPENILIVN